jgi:hypothetical protein
MIFKLLLSLEKLSYGTHGVKEFEAIPGPTGPLWACIQKA